MNEHEGDDPARCAPDQYSSCPTDRNTLCSSSSDPSLPPMGLRLRLKASYSLKGYSGESLIILRALKRYGLIVADNGSSWYVTGAPDPGWNDENLEEIKRVPGAAFEAVETGPIRRRG